MTWPYHLHYSRIYVSKTALETLSSILNIPMDQCRFFFETYETYGKADPRNVTDRINKKLRGIEVPHAYEERFTRIFIGGDNKWSYSHFKKKQ